MKRFTEILCGSAAMLFQVALTGWMFALSRINFDFVQMELNYLILSAVLLCAYYLDILIMRKGIPAPLFIIVQLAMMAIGIFAFVRCVSVEPFALSTVIINCIVFCLGFVVAAFIAWNPTNQNGILLRFDALAAMIVIMLVLDHVMGIPAAGGCLNMCYVSIALILMSAISIKVGALAGRGGAVEGNGIFGRILLVILGGIMGLIALLTVIYASSGVKSFSEFLLSVIKTCLGAVKRVFLYLYGLLERFLLWLSQFAKETEMEAVGNQMGVGNVNIESSQQMDISVPGWVYGILIAIAVAALIYLLFKLRKLKTAKISSRPVAATKVQRQSGFAEALRELWNKIKASLVFRWNCIRYRKSPAGLLAWCEKKGREELARCKGESGEAYLLRVAAIIGGEGEKALEKLACAVERSFYSPKRENVSDELFRAVRKVKFKLSK
ncbi:MAG: hypothetical protein J6P94_05280 [Oscillospiraceae bacterium]|nr:hypothetical protein [Oscillospiraceae bacterium]